MSSELILPSPAMESVLSFLDTRDVAIMAQTCNTWRRIAYRKSVWSEKNISYNRIPTIVCETIPRHARHIGSPTLVCFGYWLKQVTGGSETQTLSLHLTHMTDPATYIKEAKAYWHRHGCPCLIRDHHRLQDLLQFPFPTDFSKSDRMRVMHRLIKYSESRVYNVYCHYLECQIQKINASFTDLPPGIILDTSDPLHRFIISAHNHSTVRRRAVNAVLAAHCAKLEASLVALGRHGKAEFEYNDTWFERNRTDIWSRAGFAYKKI
jgi:hypothetical protein